jgi:hypothetical protein
MSDRRSPLRPRARRRLAALVCAGSLAGFVLAGCSKQAEVPSVVPVTGKVTIGNTALTSGQVNFYPDGGKGNTSPRVSTGMIEANGSYTLRTGSETGVLEGAPPGWYKVVIAPYDAYDTDAKKGGGKIPNVSREFTSERTTPLSVEVKPGAPPGAYDLKVR